MRARALLFSAFVALPCALGAQRIPLPRIHRRPTPQPADLPPQPPEVARSIAYHRSRWSTEAYSLLTAIQVPDNVGGTQGYTSFGTGTHGDYRYNQHFSATIDLTASSLFSPSMSGTAELGSRYIPVDIEQTVRPFVDLRASYMYLYDVFNAGGPGASDFTQEGRYSRGLGGVTGGGLEYSLSRSLSVSSELLALRYRMTSYRFTSAAGFPSASSFWMTSFRYTLGFKYNPVRIMRAVENAAR